MREELVDFEAEGRTVKRFHYNWSGEMIITFTDNTFIHFTVIKDHYSEDVEIEQESVDIEKWGSNLVEAEIMTQEELTTWKDAKRQNHLNNKEKRDKEEYERLKKQFG